MTELKAKITKKDITSELEGIRGLRSDIFSEAQKICEDVSSRIKKHRDKNLLLFYCLYRAHRLMKINISPRKVADMLQMPHNNISKALNTYSIYDEPYEAVKFTEYILKNCKELGIPEDYIQEMLAFSESIRGIDKELDEESPQKIAAGIIWYFLQRNGSDCPLKKFKEVVDLSEVTITGSWKRIQKLHNKLISQGI